MIPSSIRYASIVVIAIFGLLNHTSLAEDLSYPNAGLVVNVVTDFGADGSGNTASASANVAAFQAAVNSVRLGQPNQGKLIYIPNGTYYVDGNFNGGSDMENNKRIRIQGQSRDGTIIKLIDNAPAYQDPEAPEAIYTVLDRHSGNDSFENAVRNLTIDVGNGNPGAIALDFHTNNGGGVSNVLLKGPADAAIGLAMNRDAGGIGLIQNVTIEGFKVGVEMSHHHVCYVFDNCSFTGQSEVVVRSNEKPAQFFNCTSNNSVPFLESTMAGAQFVIVDCVLIGGSSSVNAIDFTGDSQLFIRNTIVDGYALAFSGTSDLTKAEALGEFSSHGVYTAGPQPGRSLDIPVPATPEVPWDVPTGFVLYDDPQNIPTTQITDDSVWAVIDGTALDGNGNWQDDSALIQAAMDSGASTVAFLGASKADVLSTITVGGNVRRILGMGTQIIARYPMNVSTDPIFKMVDGTHQTVIIEGFSLLEDWSCRDPLFISNHRSKDLIIHDNVVQPMRFYENTPPAGGSGRVFFVNNFSTPHWHEGTAPADQETHSIYLTNQEAYMLQHNSELLGSSKTGLGPTGATHYSVPFVINDGGTMTIRGFKFGEEQGPYLLTKNGGFTEVLGGIVNVTDAGGAAPGQVPFLNEDSNVSIIALERKRLGNSPTDYLAHTIVLRETRSGSITDVLPADVPVRTGNTTPDGFALSLYASYTERTGSFSYPTAATGRTRDDDQDGDGDRHWDDTYTDGMNVGRTHHNPNIVWVGIIEFPLVGMAHEVQNAESIQLQVSVKSKWGWSGINPNLEFVHMSEGNDGQITNSDFEAAGNVVATMPVSAFSVNSTYTIDVTGAVKADLANGEDYSSFKIRADVSGNTSSNDQVQFYTAFSGNPAEYHPALVLNNGALQAANNTPVANHDAATIDEDSSVDVDVLANDTDPDGDTLGLVSYTNGSNGSVAYSGTGGLLYTPDADFYGTDTFTYTMSDGSIQDTATVTVTVNSVYESVLAVATVSSGRTRDDDENGTGDQVWPDSYEDSLSVGHTNHVPVKEWRGIVEFDISALGTDIDGADIIEVELTNDTKWGFTGVDASIVCQHLLAGNDGTISASDHGGAAEATPTAVPVSTIESGKRYRFDVTAAVKADRAAGKTYSSFRFESTHVPNGENSQVIFFTGYSGNLPANRPNLRIIVD